MAIENKYDAVARADKIIASCTTPEQLEVARKFAERAYALMYPEQNAGLWSITHLSGTTASRIVDGLIVSRRLDIDPEYREQHELSMKMQMDAFRKEARYRLGLPEPSAECASPFVTVDVNVTID